jgi:hypothetical protein
MQNKKHKVRINLSNNSGNTRVIESKHETLPKRLFHKLFGKRHRVLIIAPSDSVTGIEIYEEVGESDANTHKA